MQPHHIDKLNADKRSHFSLCVSPTIQLCLCRNCLVEKDALNNRRIHVLGDTEDFVAIIGESEHIFLLPWEAMLSAPICGGLHVDSQGPVQSTDDETHIKLDHVGIFNDIVLGRQRYLPAVISGRVSEATRRRAHIKIRYWRRNEAVKICLLARGGKAQASRP